MVASIMTQIISTINTFNYLPDSAVISLADGTLGLRVTVIAFELIVLFVALFYLITFSSTSPFLMMAHFVGIIALLSSRDWLVAIPAWEILNLSLYLLAGVRGLQYFLISALSTTLLIGGVAIIYSLTGVTHFETIQLTQNFS
jgi:NADH:ubiquinone oxidoreductase subunit 2 (subunit N)